MFNKTAIFYTHEILEQGDTFKRIIQFNLPHVSKIKETIVQAFKNIEPNVINIINIKRSSYQKQEANPIIKIQFKQDYEFGDFVERKKEAEIIERFINWLKRKFPKAHFRYELQSDNWYKILHNREDFITDEQFNDKVGQYVRTNLAPFGLFRVYFDYDYSGHDLNKLSKQLHIFIDYLLEYDPSIKWREPTLYMNHIGFFIDEKEYILKVASDSYSIQTIDGFQIFKDKMYEGHELDFSQQLVRIMKTFRECLKYIKSFNGQNQNVNIFIRSQ